MSQYRDIVVFSHLRWNFVYQRPQHLLSRLSATKRVFFIEEPIYEENAVLAWDFVQVAPNVIVCRMRTPNPTPGFDDQHLEAFLPLLQQLLTTYRIEHYIAWLYTAMALPLAQSLRPHVVVYDCMDELSAFLHAPPQLLARESALLTWADLVFTGGPSLYQAKRDRHPAVHCFPSSVDAAHFRTAQQCSQAADMAHIPHPRLGFYGVLDERMDLGLIDAVACAHPDWQLVLVGPVVKIAPDALPQRPNIHYFGQRSYEELPSYLAGWDVCLLPFARNEATRYISPTKTLEYMAAELPIVSTSITDVAKPYGEIVYLGDTPEAFAAACAQALSADSAERARRSAAMRTVLSQTSWDTTVQAMLRLIDNIPGASRRVVRPVAPERSVAFPKPPLVRLGPS